MASWVEMGRMSNLDPHSSGVQSSGTGGRRRLSLAPPGSSAHGLSELVSRLSERVLRLVRGVHGDGAADGVLGE